MSIILVLITDVLTALLSVRFVHLLLYSAMVLSKMITQEEF